MKLLSEEHSKERKKDITLLDRILSKMPNSIDKSEVLREAHRRYSRRNNLEDELREEAIVSITCLFKNADRANEDVDSLFIEALKNLKEQ